MTWEEIDCTPLQKPTGSDTSLQRFRMALAERFSTPHWTQTVRSSLLAGCRRNVLREGAMPFLVEQRDVPLRRFPPSRHQYEDYFDSLGLPEAIPVEIWTGPRELLLHCLPQLGYRNIQSLNTTTWEAAYRGEYDGRPRLLLLGPHEWSWIYETHRQLLEASKESRKPLSFVTLAPFADPWGAYNQLAELWFFYQLRAYSPKLPRAVLVGYGPRVGTGRRFSDEYFRKHHSHCVGAEIRFPGGTLFRVRDQNQPEAHVAFIHTSPADLLTIPMFHVGKVLGEKGVKMVGIWGTAGGIRDLSLGDTFVPDSFSGFPFRFFTESLELSARRIPNALPVRQLRSFYEGKSLKEGGALGSFFHAWMENVSVEKQMTDVWRWRGVDTDSFFLFSGFTSVVPDGKVFGLFWISDLNSKPGDTPHEQMVSQTRDEESVTGSFPLIARVLDLHSPLCDPQR
jgi:hypothetical protein